MEFLENNPDFMNDDTNTFTATCNECGHEFALVGDEEAEECPGCGTKFD